MKKKTGKVFLLLISAFLFVSTMIIAGNGVLEGAGKAQAGRSSMSGWGYFKAYTADSNILMGFCSLLLIFLRLKHRKDPEYRMPRWAALLQLTGTSVVTVTLLTVVVFLSPMQLLHGGSYFYMFSGTLFFFHFFNPVLACIALILLEKDRIFTMKDCLLSLIPTVLYSVVYLIKVLTGKWIDFYGFTFGGNYSIIPIVMIIMYAAAFVIAAALAHMHNRCMKTEKNEG